MKYFKFGSGFLNIEEEIISDFLKKLQNDESIDKNIVKKISQSFKNEISSDVLCKILESEYNDCED